MTTSPPWRTDAWDLELDLAKIDQQWPWVRRILEDAELGSRRAPDVSQWSPVEHAGHVLLVSRIMADAIEGNLREPDRARDERAKEPAHRVFTAGGFRRGVATSPREALPDGHSREDLLSMLPGVVDAWERIRERAAEVGACPARSEHFMLGYLTSAEWARMCAIHTAHHLRVIRDIVGEEVLDPDGHWRDA